MTLKEFMEKTGIKLTFLCEKIGITRQTVYRINTGEAVSEEVALRLKNFCGDEVEIPIVKSEKGHIRNRSKKACEMS